jgi:hypothetical protein
MLWNPCGYLRLAGLAVNFAASGDFVLVGGPATLSLSFAGKKGSYHA